MAKSIQFHCVCGQYDHNETIVEGEKTIVCSRCGAEYFTGSSLREVETK